MTQPVFSAAGFDAIRLTDEAAPALQNLFDRCLDYFEMVEGRAALGDAAQREFSDVPPGHDQQNLLVFGLYHAGDALAGVLIALRHYPQPDQWYVSLLLLDPAWRGRKIARQCYFAFEEWVRGQGGESLLLAVVECNEHGAKFWQHLGFALPRCFAGITLGLKTHILIEFEKPLI